MKLVLASSNAGKRVELRELLAGSDIELVAQTELGIEDAEETGLTFVENAILKARHAARASGLPALADDSGICVDALDGAPGLYSALYAGTHGDNAGNNAKLLHELEGVPDPGRTAHSSSVCSHCCVTPAIRTRSSQPAAGRAASCTRRAANKASVTTRCSCPTTAMA